MSANQSQSPVKTAVILLNMGGPQSKDEVHPYLKELFQDRELLKLPFQKYSGILLLGEELQKYRKGMRKLVSTPRPSN